MSVPTDLVSIKECYFRPSFGPGGMHMCSCMHIWCMHVHHSPEGWWYDIPLPETVSSHLHPAPVPLCQGWFCHANPLHGFQVLPSFNKQLTTKVVSFSPKCGLPFWSQNYTSLKTGMLRFQSIPTDQVKAWYVQVLWKHVQIGFLAS